MRSLAELKQAVANKVTLVWGDPDPIEGNDYTIHFIEELNDLDEDSIKSYPITILYGHDVSFGGLSQADVFLHEILIKE